MGEAVPDTERAQTSLDGLTCTDSVGRCDPECYLGCIRMPPSTRMVSALR